MKLPRNVSGAELVVALQRFGYQVARQRGSHVRMVTEHGGEHHIVIPAHHPIKPGTLSDILKSVSEHHGITREELIEQLKI